MLYRCFGIVVDADTDSESDVAVLGCCSRTPRNISNGLSKQTKIHAEREISFSVLFA